MLGSFKLLNILLQAGADINAPLSSWEGRTAIEGAAENGRLDTVSCLLEAGADIQGKLNTNYRRTVYRAWKHGHRFWLDWCRNGIVKGMAKMTASLLDQSLSRWIWKPWDTRFRI